MRLRPPEASAATNPGIRHLESLDGIRGIACLMVFYCHLEYSPYMPYTNLPLNFGFLGVLLFFVLSGFLMGFLYLDTVAPRKIAHYLLKRFFRIYPLFFVASIAGIYFAQTVGFHSLLRFNLNKVDFDFDYLIAQLLLKKGWAGLWTIPVEMHFYAVFAVLLFITARFATLRLFIFLISAIFLLAVSDLPGNAQQFRMYIEQKSYFYMWNFMGIFLCGVFFGVLFRRWKDHKILDLVCQWVAGISTAAIVGVLIFSPINALFPRTLIEVDWADAYWLTPITGLYILCCAVASNGKYQLSTNPFLCFTGKISYSLYIWHIIILFVKIPYVTGGAPITLLWIICFIYCVSIVTYMLIEKPAINFAAKLIK